MLETPNYVEIIAWELTLWVSQVEVVWELLAEWATVPFIARYRKEKTWNLDENQIRQIIDLQKKYENLYQAKVTAINGITQLELMTDELYENIVKASSLKEVEEIYKPYKSKKKTKAMIAIEKWFQSVADILKQNKIEISHDLSSQYPYEEILEWAQDIIAAEISVNADLRRGLISELKKYGEVVSSKKSEKMLEKLNEKDKEQISKFELYFDKSIKASSIKPYQTLALNRGENLWILTVKIAKDDIIFWKIERNYAQFLNLRWEFISELFVAFKNGYEALFGSVENEIRSDLNEIAEDNAIETFQTNLSALLLSKPEYGKTILAIDPGYKAWCKLAVLDALWTPIFFDKIFLHQLQNAKTRLKDIFEKYQIQVVVVWNGTATDETQELIGELFSGDVYVVNESGASVYSASDIAQEEFPDLDSLDRGTISIGRRYIDPLSELVKVPVGSIWVGMYQHDIAPKKLEEKLGYVVEDAVNQVGINVNTASIYLLNHISWIDKRQAKKIYNHRPYVSRQDLKKVLSEKVYEQAIWFLRVPESQEFLDNTDIHPEQYVLAKYIIAQPQTSQIQLNDEMKQLYSDVNQDTIKFILESYKNLWQEKRTVSTHTKAKKALVFSELKIGDRLEWVVRNVVAFWAFVDIGLKNDGLVHISELADVFVKNPLDIVQVWDKVQVKIVNIDSEKQKLQLSMKEI